MGSIIPRTHAEFLASLESLAPVWEERFAQIGVPHDEAAAVLDLLGAAKDAQFKRAAYDEALRAAVDAQEVAFEELRRAAGRLVARVRAYAESSARPSAVYQAAMIPAPRPRRRPGTVPPPAMPTRLRATLIATTGALALTWNATNPPGTEGTSYIVRRRVPGSAEFVFLNVTGAKRYVDASIPVGAAHVEYTVQGQRAGRPGPVSAILRVNFGVEGADRVQVDDRRRIGNASVRGGTVPKPVA